jgi:3-phenylpropionate/trans-cinnamate dioxygenase ferredoxin subunit
MANWIEIGPVSDFSESAKTCVTVADKPLVICHIDDQWFSVLNICPHAGLPLGDGELRGSILTCPFHGYTYNVRTGANIDFPTEEPPVSTFAIKVDSGQVFVDLEPSN